MDSYNEIYKNVENYTICQKILGSGSFGEVRLAYRDGNKNEPIAAKMISKAKLEENERNLTNVKRELEIMKKFNHPNIVNLIGTEETVNFIYLFMEFCNQGDLRRFLNKKGNLSEEKAMLMMKDFLEAMKYLVSKDCIHRDLKPENILIHNGKLKLADFGFSKLVENMDISARNTLLGTPLYASPQILEGLHYSSKCDVYSTGLIFYEILYGEHPYGKLPPEIKSVKHLTKEINKKVIKIPAIPPRNEMLKEILLKMLEKEEEARFSWEAVFKSFDFLALETESVVLNEKFKLEREKAFLFNEALAHLGAAHLSKKFPQLPDHLYYRVVYCVLLLFLQRLEVIEKKLKEGSNEKSWEHYLKTIMYEDIRRKFQSDLVTGTKTYKKFDKFLKRLSRQEDIPKEIKEFNIVFTETTDKMLQVEKIFLDLLNILTKLANNEFEKAEKAFLIAVCYLNICKNMETYFSWPPERKDAVPYFKEL